jgi:adenylate cyclase
MAKEIERKFLVKAESWRAAVVERKRLCDGLLIASKERKVRIRVAGERATLAFKDKRNGAQRNEFEYPIPLEDARELLDHHCASKVSKIRHVVHHQGHRWEVDEYDELGVTIAEIELANVDQRFDLPPWIGRDVTHDNRYRKRNIVARHAKAKLKRNGKPVG